MADTVTPETRSRMMASIRSKDTLPELAIRRGLHALGFRYSLHSKRLPGRPDMAFPKHRAVIWMHGCYWHGHDCADVKRPASNQGYWSPKIEGNRARDARNQAAAGAAGWRHLVIWECCFRRRGPEALAETVRRAAEWLREGLPSGELSGQSM